MGMRIANLGDTPDVLAKTVLWQYDRAPNLQQLLWHERKDSTDTETVQDGFLQLVLSSMHALGESFYTFIFDAVNTAERESELTDEEKEKLEFGLGLWTVIAGLERPYVTDGETQRLVSLRAWARYIKGEIFKFYSNGSCESLNEFLTVTLKDTPAHVVDNNNMTQNYIFDAEPTGDDKDLIEVDDFLPHPGGVESVSITEYTDDIFGYNGFYTAGGAVLCVEQDNDGYYYAQGTSPNIVYPFVSTASTKYDSNHDPLTYDQETKTYYKIVTTSYDPTTDPVYSLDSEGVYHLLTYSSATGKWTYTSGTETVEIGKAFFFWRTNNVEPYTYARVSYAVVSGQDTWTIQTKSAPITQLYTLLSDGTTYAALTKATAPYNYYTIADTEQRYYDPGTTVYAWIRNPSNPDSDTLTQLELDTYLGTYFYPVGAVGSARHYVLGQQLQNYEHGRYYAGVNPRVKNARVYLGMSDMSNGQVIRQSTNRKLGNNNPKTTIEQSAGIFYDSTKAK